MGEWFQPACKRIVTSVQYQYIYSSNGSFEHALISRGYGVIKAIFFCRYHSHLLCQQIIVAFALRMHIFYIYMFLYSTYSYGRMAYKSPMPLKTQVFYISCICNGILPGFNAVKDLCLKHRLITRVGKFQGHFHFPLASEKAFLPAYSMAICCVTANITA